MSQFRAYCKRPASLTKEHLWPAGLHKRLLTLNQEAKGLFWLARLQREIPSEPQIRDVCEQCNNVTLSELDNYICRLFDTAFSRIAQRNELIEFSYDYHPLKRWLLKMCFNSARIHNSVDRDALEVLVPYILDGRDSIGNSAQLFIQLTYPQAISEQEFDQQAIQTTSYYSSPV
jgi:hypothetical protein